MKKFLSLAMAIVLAFSIVGCSNDPGESSESNSTDTPQPTGQESNVNKGGIMQMADSGEVNSLVWLNLSGYNDMIQSSMIYDYLLLLDVSGNVVPNLCESFTADADNLTYTLKLRKGILFQDLSPFNAEACKWNLDMYLEQGVKNKAFLSNVESFEVVDEYTVAIHLTTWDTTIPIALCKEPGAMFSKQQWETYGAEYCEQHPIGTGPFILESWERDVNKTYVKFDQYWQGEPNLDGIELTIYHDSLVAQAAIEMGDIDEMFISDFSMAKTLSSNGYNVVVGGQPTRITMLCFDETDEGDPLSDLRVRQAISHAIDKQAIVDAIYLGYAQPTNQFAYPGSVYYSEDVVGYDYDLEKAKALLADAGYPDGFSTTLIARSDATLANVAAALQDQLSKIGVTVELDVVDGGAFSTLLTGWGTGLFQHNSNLPTSITYQMNSMFRNDLSGNVLGLSTLLHPQDVHDGIVSAVGAETEEDAQNDIKHVQELLFDKYCLFAPVCVTYESVVKSDRLKDDGINEVTLYQNTLWKAWLDE